MQKNWKNIVFGAIALAFVAVSLLSYQKVIAGDVDNGEVKAKSQEVWLNERIDYRKDGSIKPESEKHKLGDEEEKYSEHYEIFEGNLVTTSQRLTPPGNMEFIPLGEVNGKTTYVDIYKNVEDLNPIRIDGRDNELEIQVKTISPWTNAASYPLRAEGNLGSPGDGSTPHWSIKTLNLTRVDIDADTDNDSTLSHREPSKSDAEDAVEYDVNDVVPGIIIGVNDDHDECLPEVADGDWDQDLQYHESDALRTDKDVARTENDNACVEPIKLRVKIDKPLKPGKFSIKNIPPAIRVFHWDTKEKITSETLFDISAGSSWDKTFYFEGLDETSESVNIEGVFRATGYNKDVAFDLLRITSAKVDIDVDSNNNGTEAYDNAEDLIEAAPTEPGLIVPVEPTPDNPNIPIADLRRGKVHKLSSIWPDIIEAANLYPVVKLKKLSGDGNIRVYEPDGTLVLDTSQTGACVDIYGIVDSVDLSLRFMGLAEGPVVLALEATVNGVKVHIDKIKVQVVKTISYAPYRNYVSVWEPCHTWELEPEGSDAVCGHVDDYGWNVTTYCYSDTTGEGAPDSCGTCTLENFKKMTNGGIVLASSHGAQGDFTAVYFDEEINAEKWMKKLASTPQGDDQINGDTITTGADGICNTTRAEAYEEQIIPSGQGAPNAVAITAGANGVLNSTPGGDDQPVGTSITTGANGVCETTKAGDDVQDIPLNQGLPNQVCIRATPEVGMSVYEAAEADGMFGVSVTADWFADNWSSQTISRKSVVWIMSCHSSDGGNNSVAYKAGGRVRLGYPGCQTSAHDKHNADIFFPRLIGTAAAGWNKNKRTAGEVYSGGGYQANLDMLGPTMRNWTTLHPAPLHTFPGSAPSKRKGTGCIVFDTYMDRITSADKVVKRISGTLPTTSYRWFGFGQFGQNNSKKYGVTFSYDKTNGGNATMRSEAFYCKHYTGGGIGGLGREMAGDLQHYGSKKDWSY
ncbi:MAG: hypothetical protein K8S55_05310 [Phycisphaerae bacterium]|nr:hypothetical protein [Phycisphaerae bacterium]